MMLNLKNEKNLPKGLRDILLKAVFLPYMVIIKVTINFSSDQELNIYLYVTLFCMTFTVKIVVINREAKEIIRLVASVCPCVCVHSNF